MSNNGPTIDLNADIGEGFSVYQLGQDEVLIPLVTSVNIACGVHAGDPSTMRDTVRLAKEAGVSIGAHPGLPDREGFGRRAMDVSPQEVYDLVMYQVGALYGFVRAQEALLRHVKPHGALYHMANKDDSIASALVQAVIDLRLDLHLMAPAIGALAVQAKQRNVTLQPEVFADRAYGGDGTLVPRGEANAMIRDAEEAAEQLYRIVHGQPIRTVDGVGIIVRGTTACIHGDEPDAADFVRRLRASLTARGIMIASADA